MNSRYGGCRIRVRRKFIFQDSFSQFQKISTQDLKGRLSVEFEGEEGMDAGGVSREWFLLLSKEIFNEDYALFKLSSTGNTYQPNPYSYFNHDHISYFKFIGRFVAKALYDGQLLDAYFTRSFYKHILGIPLTYHDMEDQDYTYYKSLKWIVENDITGMEQTYSYQTNDFGKDKTIEIIKDGSNILVTEENKLDYVQKVAYHKMAETIKLQIESFLEGFHELIPSSLIQVFDSHDLELIISGLPDIDI